VNLRDKMLRYQGKVCPMIQNQLEKNKKDAERWYPYWSGDDQFSMFEVVKDNDKFVVNLANRSCSCRKWCLTDIPCCHVVACMWNKNLVPETYVASPYRYNMIQYLSENHILVVSQLVFILVCCKKNTFLATYSYIIRPNYGPKLWPILDSEPIQPPHMRRAPGRPKKKRNNKVNDEPHNPYKLRRQYVTVHCKRCGKLGHNVRTCKGKTAANREMPKRGNKVC